MNNIFDDHFIEQVVFDGLHFETSSSIRVPYAFEAGSKKRVSDFLSITTGRASLRAELTPTDAQALIAMLTNYIAANTANTKALAAQTEKAAA